MKHPFTLKDSCAKKKPASKLFRSLIYMVIFLSTGWIGFLCLCGIIFGGLSMPKNKEKPKLPDFNLSTRIILKKDHFGKLKVYDLSGDQEVIDALNDLTFGHHIIGRTISQGSMSGYININKELFSIESSFTEGGQYRAILENEANGGWWEGHKLAEVLLKKVGN